jgi:hypothetical protein
MPDISMCNNTDCDKHIFCYRYRAIPSEWQSWTEFRSDEEDKCFIDIKGYDLKSLKYTRHGPDVRKKK